MWVNHRSQDINVTEQCELLCQFSSVPLWEKQRVRSVTFFYSIHLKVVYSWAAVVWKQHKTKKKKRGNTFCVTSEPHLLAVITKAYVPGFYIHITSIIIWFVHPYMWVIPGPRRRFTKDNMNGRGSSVHIYNIKNASRLLKQAERVDENGKWVTLLHRRLSPYADIKQL